jgi:hypothetical protein
MFRKKRPVSPARDNPLVPPVERVVDAATTEVLGWLLDRPVEGSDAASGTSINGSSEPLHQQCETEALKLRGALLRSARHRVQQDAAYQRTENRVARIRLWVSLGVSIAIDIALIWRLRWMLMHPLTSSDLVWPIASLVSWAYTTRRLSKVRSIRHQPGEVLPSDPEHDVRTQTSRDQDQDSLKGHAPLRSLALGLWDSLSRWL